MFKFPENLRDHTQIEWTDGWTDMVQHLMCLSRQTLLMVSQTFCGSSQFFANFLAAIFGAFSAMKKFGKSECTVVARSTRCTEGLYHMASSLVIQPDVVSLISHKLQCTQRKSLYLYLYICTACIAVGCTAYMTRTKVISTTSQLASSRDQTTPVHEFNVWWGVTFTGTCTRDSSFCSMMALCGIVT